jgi:hypothetical protein
MVRIHLCNNQNILEVERMVYTFNKRKAIKLLKDNNIEPDTIDLESYPGDIEFSQWVFNEYGIVLKGLKERHEDSKAAQEMAKEKEAIRLEQEKQELIKSMKEENLKGMIAIPKLSIVSNLIKSTIKSEDINFCVISGSGGIGKSFTAISTLKELKTDYEILKGKTTPLMLYNFLYKNNGKTLLFDDLMGVLDSDISVSILLSALWSTNSHRIVQYKTTSKLFTELELPDTFNFTGKIILLTNEELIKNKTLLALKDRGFFYELSFNYDEKIQFMKEMVKIEHSKLSKEMRAEVMTALEENSNPATDNFSFRTLLKAYTFRYSIENWRDMIKTILPKDDALNFVWQTIKLNMSVKDSVIEFINMGMGSRAKFFRLKKQLGITVSQ